MGTFGRTPLPWKPLPFMDEYLLEMEVLMRHPNHIMKARTCLAHFGLFCEQKEIQHPEHITRRDLLLFQGYVNGRKDWTDSYSQSILRVIHAWINWCQKLGYMTHNPWQGIKIKNIPKTPNPLSDEEVQQLFMAHRQTRLIIAPFVYHRREVILTLLYAWGLRIHELEALNVAAVDPRLSYVTAINKGGGNKQLPYNSMLKDVIRRYLKTRVQYAKLGEDALLLDVRGKRLSQTRIREIVTDLGRRAGVRVHPHQMRDTCGTHLLDSDMAAERVQKILGHKRLAQTLAYARVNDRKVAEAHEAAMTPRLEALVHGRTSDLTTTSKRAKS